MSELIQPLSVLLTADALTANKLITRSLRKLSDLADHYSDKEIVQEILSQADPIIYEYWEHEYTGANRGLSFGATRILPGRIGLEYHQTRGHFHANDQGDEIYIVLKGEGLLLLFSKNGQEKAFTMTPGSLYYIPGNMAHRTVNTGDDDLVFVAIWPPKIDHDYTTVAEKGFPKLAVEGADGATLIDNPTFNTSRPPTI